MANEDFVKKAKDLQNILIKMEKTEIHLHLEGLVTADTIWTLMNKHKLQYSGINSKHDIKNKFKVKNLSEFLDLYINVVQNSFKTEEDIELLIRDAQTYLKTDNIVYAEIFFAPSKFLKMGLDYGLMMEILTEGSRALKDKSGIEVKFIVDVSRSFGVENAMNNLDLLLKHRVPPVIGIGLGGSEKDGPPEMFTGVFEKARENGLRTVVHAGEDVGPESVWNALKHLKAERIGHGISSILDEKLMEYLAESRIPLEVCPTSNLFTRKYVTAIEDHPVKKFYERNMYVTINSDDPTLFSTSLVDEYMLLFNHGIFTKEEILQLVKNNIDATFLTPEDKTDIWERNKKIIG